MCCGAVQLTPIATTEAKGASAAAQSPIGSPWLVWSPSRQEKLIQPRRPSSSISRASARASTRQGRVSQAIRSAPAAFSTSRRGRWKAISASSSRP